MKNVAILMQSRTASSLVAGMFRAHGWHTGGDGVVTRDYVSHESQAVKARLVQEYGVAMTDPAPAVADEQLRKILGTIPEPWAWKGDIFYANVFRATFPDLAWVYVKRFIPDAVRSSLNERAMPIMRAGRAWYYDELAAELAAFLRRKYDLMVELETEWGGKVVYTTDVLRGRYHTIRNAIQYAGGEWDEALALTAFKGAPPK